MYASLTYLLARPPLGIVHLVTTVPGLNLNLYWVSFSVVVPGPAAALRLAIYVSVTEARLVCELRGSTVSYHPALPGNLPVAPYPKAAVSS